MKKKIALILACSFLVAIGLGSLCFANTEEKPRRDEDQAFRFLVKLLDGLERVSPEYRSSQNNFENSIHRAIDKQVELHHQWIRDRRGSEEAEKKASEANLEANQILFEESLDAGELFLQNLSVELKKHREDLKKLMVRQPER